MKEDINHKVFYQQIKTGIPALLEEGYKMATVSNIAELRLQDLNHSTFYSSTALLCDKGRGRIKIDPDSGLIKKIDTFSVFNSDGLVLKNGVYSSLDSQEFTRKEVNKYFDSSQTLIQAKDNPILAVIIPDKSLREDYIDLVYRTSEEKRNMFMVSQSKVDEDTLYALSLGNCEFGSYIDSWVNFDDVVHRIVGVK